MLKRLFGILLLGGFSFTVCAQDVAYKILHETDTTVSVKLSGVTLGSREVKFYRYEYPSKDADGKSVSISGIIMAPSDVVSGSVPCDGVVMFNHATIGNPSQAPSQGGLEAPSAMLANPLRPNYIIVMSDYIGYGSSSDHPICYLAGDTNARNSLDGLLAARQLFEDKGIPQGKYLFNVGYSQGGTESMYASKLRDMEYKDKGITFDKTFAGGGMLDCEKAYDEYVKKDQCDAINDVAMFLISLNENFHMGIDYKDLFKEPLASNVQEVIKTKDKGVLSRIGVSDIEYLHDLLQPAYMDPESVEYKALKAKLAEVKISNGWEPDLTQRYYLEHSRHDNYVPIQCARELLTWMVGKGFTPSLVPGKTNLQTCTLVFKLKHQSSGIVWAIQTMAAIQFWPVLYHEGELNRFYYGVVKDLDVMKVLTTLEGWGLDVRKLVKGSLSPQHRSQAVAIILNLIPNVREALAKVDLTADDLAEMLDDAGITDEDVVRVAAYLFSSPSAPAYNRSVQSVIDERGADALFLPRLYEQKLAGWFLLGGYDVDYSSWGW